MVQDSPGSRRDRGGSKRAREGGTTGRGQQEGKSWGMRDYHCGGGLGCDTAKLKVTKGSESHSCSRKLL